MYFKSLNPIKTPKDLTILNLSLMWWTPRIVVCLLCNATMYGSPSIVVVYKFVHFILFSYNHFAAGMNITWSLLNLKYHMVGNILAWNLIWHFGNLHTNYQINIHQYELSGYYKPLALYHFIKLKFPKRYFEVNSSNLFPANISGYTVCTYFRK